MFLQDVSVTIFACFLLVIGMTMLTGLACTLQQVSVSFSACNGHNTLTGLVCTPQNVSVSLSAHTGQDDIDWVVVHSAGCECLSLCSMGMMTLTGLVCTLQEVSVSL